MDAVRITGIENVMYSIRFNQLGADINNNEKRDIDLEDKDKKNAQNDNLNEYSHLVKQFKFRII